MASLRRHGTRILDADLTSTAAQPLQPAQPRRCLGIALALAMLFLLTAAAATEPAQAQSFNVLHNFTGGPDGSTARGRVDY